MAALSRHIITLMVEEYGTRHVLERLSDPFWFQALGCVLGFDWHSSGVTTTVCGALSQGLSPVASDLGFYVCGGKGGRSRHTPQQITDHCMELGLDADPLVTSSKLSAKIDSVALQDGYQLYHHSFCFDAEGTWCVIQQGMADENDPLGVPHRGFARRYHWLGSHVTEWDREPHSAICCEKRGQLTLNLVADDSEDTRQSTVSLVSQDPATLLSEVRRLPQLSLASRHGILARDIHPQRIEKTLLATYERQPKDFVSLIAGKGVGPKTMRALALVSEVVHGTTPSFSDPARFSFAHGGKDGIPYPVNRTTYAETIATLKDLLDHTKAEHSEKRKAFTRLARFEAETP